MSSNGEIFREGSHRVQEKNIDDDFFDDSSMTFDDFDDDPEFLKKKMKPARELFLISTPGAPTTGFLPLPLNFYWHLGMEKGFSDGWGISSKPCFQTGWSGVPVIYYG